MGKTAFDGPVYGAKDTLFSFRYPSAISAGSTLISVVVPPGETWLATELIAGASSGSSAGRFDLAVNGTTIVNVAPTDSTVAEAVQEITPTGGEVEGRRIAAGSTVTIVASVAAMAQGSGCVRGFHRYTPSTRG